MKLDRVFAIAAREVSAIRKSRALWLPMVMLPLILFIIIPAVVAVLPQLLPRESLERDIQDLIARVPEGMKALLPLDRPAVALVEFMLGQALAPMFVLVPVMTASLVAADAFAGERERRTLEALLHTPTTDLEIFAGKVLGAIAPAFATCVGGLVVVSVVADIAAWPLVGRPLLPSPLWLAMALVLAPAVAALTVIAMVVVSARVRGFQEASQLGALFVLPIVGLVVGQVSGAMMLSPLVVLAIGVAVFALDVALVWVVGRTFRRDDLFMRM